MPYLAGTLPYAIKARSQQFSSIPAALQAKFRYQIYSDARSAAWGESPLMGFEAPTAALAGKKLTLAQERRHVRPGAASRRPHAQRQENRG